MPSTTLRLVLIRGLKIRPTFILFVTRYMTLASNTLNNKVKEERDIYATSWLDRSRDIFLNQHFQCYF